MPRQVKKSTRKSSNTETQRVALTALVLSIAALVIGMAGFVYLFLGTKSVDKHSNRNDAVQNVIVNRLNKCLDRKISPCPTADDSKWSNGDYIGE